MIELNFLAFCITVVALTAIVFGKEDVAKKALSVLSMMTKQINTICSSIFSDQRNNR